MDKIIEAVNTKKCVACGNCISICPVSAISLQVNNGFEFPNVNQNVCINCHKCNRVCPVNGDSIHLCTPRSYYAAYVSENAMHQDSTSGGLCTFATEFMVRNGGVVYSVCFNDEWDVNYARLDSLDKLKAHIGSKYMQAHFNNVQKEIETDLRNDKRVLLIGTPCFVGAVKKYLIVDKVDTRNLVTIDFLCHGVPSAEIGKAFINSLEKKTGRKLEKYNFRSKEFGWGKLSRSIKYIGKKEKSIRADFCPLHTWFGQHLSLRESCFQCEYRNIDRPSDITVADFWKIDKYYPEIPMKQGVSAVQVNTDSGNAFYNLLLERGALISFTVTKESIWEHRRTATKNFVKPDRYDEFWNVYANQGMNGIMKMFPSQTVMGLVIDKIKSMAR